MRDLENDNPVKEVEAAYIAALLREGQVDGLRPMGMLGKAFPVPDELLHRYHRFLMQNTRLTRDEAKFAESFISLTFKGAWAVAASRWGKFPQ